MGFPPGYKARIVSVGRSGNQSTEEDALSAQIAALAIAFASGPNPTTHVASVGKRKDVSGAVVVDPHVKMAIPAMPLTITESEPRSATILLGRPVAAPVVNKRAAPPVVVNYGSSDDTSSDDTTSVSSESSSSAWSIAPARPTRAAASSSSSSSSTRGRGRGRGGGGGCVTVRAQPRHLKDAAIAVLRHWFLTHQDHPYPSRSERTRLGQQVSMTEKQVNNWFINGRKRFWLPNTAPDVPLPYAAYLAKWINVAPRTVLPSGSECPPLRWSCDYTNVAPRLQPYAAATNTVGNPAIEVRTTSNRDHLIDQFRHRRHDTKSTTRRASRATVAANEEGDDEDNDNVVKTMVLDTLPAAAAKKTNKTTRASAKAAPAAAKTAAVVIKGETSSGHSGAHVVVSVAASSLPVSSVAYNTRDVIAASLALPASLVTPSVYPTTIATKVATFGTAATAVAVPVVHHYGDTDSKSVVDDISISDDIIIDADLLYDDDTASVIIDDLTPVTTTTMDDQPDGVVDGNTGGGVTARRFSNDLTRSQPGHNLFIDETPLTSLPVPVPVEVSYPKIHPLYLTGGGTRASSLPVTLPSSSMAALAVSASRRGSHGDDMRVTLVDLSSDESLINQCMNETFYTNNDLTLASGQVEYMVSLSCLPLSPAGFH